MLGITPLVSISERRLGLITNSSMPRDSARDVLDNSTSRSVSPIYSRSSRNFLPADNTVFILNHAIPADFWTQRQACALSIEDKQILIFILTLAPDSNLKTKYVLTLGL